MSQIIISNNQISVQFIQYVAGETDIIIRRGDFLYSDVVDSKEAKERCQRYLDNGFKVVSINGVAVKDGKVMNTEKKVTSPKKPKVEKPKVSREEALTKAYGSKEDRKAYVEARAAFRRFYLNKGMKYGKEFEATVKNALRKWNEAGRPAYNC